MCVYSTHVMAQLYRLLLLLHVHNNSEHGCPLQTNLLPYRYKLKPAVSNMTMN